MTDPMSMPPVREEVIVLDTEARPTGAEEKQAAHMGLGIPHLAFSVVLFDPDGSVLLQQRARGKYHFPLFWSNSCCSHPRPYESLLDAADRRIQQELGVTADDLSVRGAFWYRARDRRSGLVEHEYDVVLTGELTPCPRPDPTEIAAVRWMTRDDLTAGEPQPVEPMTPWLSRTLELAFADEAAHVSPHIRL